MPNEVAPPQSARSDPARSDPARSDPALNERVQLLVEEYVDFVWRSLRSLGVPHADCDDGCQKVWWIVARKASDIEAGKERSFIFSVVVRVASDMRRSAARRPAAELDVEVASDAPGPDELCDRRRARALLEGILDGMPWDQRVVFVMYELEGLNSLDIASDLELSRGTVASRLRLARAHFERALSRYQQRHEFSLPQPSLPQPSLPQPSARKPRALAAVHTRDVERCSK